MKAKELMCDDLVSHRGNTYKVFGIMRNADGVDLAPVHLRNAEGLMLGPITCFATEIEPIPLTEEILENNDFEIVGHHAMFYVNKDSIEEASIHIDYVDSVDIDTPDYRYSGWCKEVHTLQHILRLCGLDDIADNLKV